VKVGDIIYWANSSGSEDLTHTGIIVEILADNSAKIIQANCRGACDGTSTLRSLNDINNASSNGHLWEGVTNKKGVSIQKHFMYWGRIK
jgi:hypothetical protein